jgi:multiple sugar transport system permease protein
MHNWTEWLSKISEFMRKAFKLFKINLFGGSAKIVPKLLLYFILIIFSLIYIEPILYMISMSFKSFSDLSDPTAKWIPKEGTLTNFKFAISQLKVIPKFTSDKTFWQTISSSPMILSIITAVPAALIQMFTCGFVGYGFGKLKVPCKKFLIVLLIFNYIVPPQVTFIPTAWVFKNFKLINTPLAFIVPALFANGIKSSIFILIYMQFFRKIPNELEEAALIDGAGYLKIFRKVMFPLAKPAKITVFLFSLVWHWNDTYLTGVLYPSLNTMSTVISVVKESTDYTYYAGNSYNILQVKMASCLLLIAPVLIVYIFTQKHFTESIERTGIVE